MANTTRVTLDYHNRSYSVQFDDFSHLFSSIDRFDELTGYVRGDVVGLVFELERNMFFIEYGGGTLVSGVGKPEIQWISDNLENIRQAAITDHQETQPPLTIIRDVRNSKLHETDWLVIRHQEETLTGAPLTLSPTQLQELRVYREQLRAMSAAQLSSTDVTSATWPIPPSFVPAV